MLRGDGQGGTADSGLAPSNVARLNTSNAFAGPYLQLFGGPISVAGPALFPTTGGTPTNWRIRAGSFLGQDGVQDEVFGQGYNLGNELPNEPQWYTQLEANWKVGGKTYQEWYIQQTNPGTPVTTYRPIMVQVQRDVPSPIGAIQFSGAVNMIPSTEQNQLGSAKAGFQFGQDGKIMLGAGDVRFSASPVEIWDPIRNESALLIGSSAIGGAGTDASLGFYATNGPSNRPEYVRLGLNVTNGAVGAESGDMTFSTRSNGSLGERMRVTSDGKLGIGLSPKYTVDALGPVRTSRNNAAGKFGAFLIGNVDAQIYNDGQVTYFDNLTGDLNFYQRNSNIRFSTNGQQRMTLSGSTLTLTGDLVVTGTINGTGNSRQVSFGGNVSAAGAANFTGTTTVGSLQSAGSGNFAGGLSSSSVSTGAISAGAVSAQSLSSSGPAAGLTLQDRVTGSNWTMSSSGDEFALSGSAGERLTVDSSGNAEFAGSVSPTADGKSNLGSPANGWQKLYIRQTLSPAGQTGPVTINAAAGSARVAAGESTVTVTDSLCTANSLVFAVVRTADATAYVKNVIPLDGSFTINLGAAATGETEIAFHIVN